MHNHNSEIHIEEDTKMPNGSNPYIRTEAGEQAQIDAVIQYLSDIDFSSAQGTAGNWYDYWADPIYSTTGTQSYDINLPSSYKYQGMSPDVMRALGDVFGIGDASFTPQGWNESNIMAQITSQFQEDAPEEWIQGPQNWQEEYNLSPVGGSSWGLDLDWDSSPNYGAQVELGDVDYGDIDSALGYTDIFDPESIANTLSQLGGLGEDIRPGEIKALTPEMLKKTESAYYAPVEQARRESLVEKLGKARGGVSTGGFAGSGARQSGLSGAEKLYRGGYENILADIMKMRAGATEDVMDTIYGWQELIDQP